MTTRDPISNMDPSQREVAIAQQQVITAFAALVADAANADKQSALRGSLAIMLHKLTNMFYASTVHTIEYATEMRNRAVSELQATVAAIRERLTSHDRRLTTLEHRLARIETALEFDAHELSGADANIQPVQSAE